MTRPGNQDTGKGGMVSRGPRETTALGQQGTPKVAAHTVFCLVDTYSEVRGQAIRGGAPRLQPVSASGFVL